MSASLQLCRNAVAHRVHEQIPDRKGNKGKRVQDESRGYLACCHALMRRKEYVANWVFDSTAFEAYKDSYFKIPLTRDVVSKYASLEELAQKEGIDKKNLVETIKRYNAGVDKGKDTEFGRTKNLKRIEKAPFYSFECSPKIYTSYSGLEINIEAQVLTQTGDVIPGLYAAGFGGTDCLIGRPCHSRGNR